MNIILCITKDLIVILILSAITKMTLEQRVRVK